MRRARSECLERERLVMTTRAAYRSVFFSRAFGAVLTSADGCTEALLAPRLDVLNEDAQLGSYSSPRRRRVAAMVAAFCCAAARVFRRGRGRGEGTSHVRR